MYNTPDTSPCRCIPNKNLSNVPKTPPQYRSISPTGVFFIVDKVLLPILNYLVPFQNDDTLTTEGDVPEVDDEDRESCPRSPETSEPYGIRVSRNLSNLSRKVSTSSLSTSLSTSPSSGSLNFYHSTSSFTSSTDSDVLHNDGPSSEEEEGEGYGYYTDFRDTLRGEEVLRVNQPNKIIHCINENEREEEEG